MRATHFLLAALAAATANAERFSLYARELTEPESVPLDTVDKQSVMTGNKTSFNLSPAYLLTTNVTVNNITVRLLHRVSLFCSCGSLKCRAFSGPRDALLDLAFMCVFDS
jgi:hypothetical protein